MKILSICALIFSIPIITVLCNKSVNHQSQEILNDVGFSVSIHNSDKAYQGTTFFVYKYVDPDILYEVDMEGNVVWKLELPDSMGSNQTEAELLPDNTILLINQSVGIFRMDRNGTILWQHRDPKVSHDADLLSNGNILYVYGMGDAKGDTIVKEITPAGQRIWGWVPSEYFDYSPYSEIDPSQQHGWAHANSVTRLQNGNTLISIRNFNMIVIVNTAGIPVDTIADAVKSPHDPQVLDNGNILVAHQTPDYHAAIELEYQTNDFIWEFGFTSKDDFPVRDANLLPNGNILITGAKRIIEVTRDNEIVWQLELTDPITPGHGPSQGFYKAVRLN